MTIEILYLTTQMQRWIDLRVARHLEAQAAKLKPAAGRVLLLLLHPARTAENTAARIVNVAIARRRLGEAFIGSLKRNGTTNRQSPMRYFCVSR